MAIEMKVVLVKEAEEIIGAFVMIVPDHGMPTILGSVDEPMSVEIINRQALMNGLGALPQELLATVDQCSAYEPQNIEELQERFVQMELIE